MPRCQSKQALMRGLRPSPQQKIHCAVCRRVCIFCDVWKLASLVYTHVPLSNRYSTSPENLQKLSSEPSYNYAQAEKAIEAAFSSERVRLASIMSICTVEGADESEGIWIAHDRCLTTVKELLYQEALLEEALIRAPSPEPYSQYSYSSRASRQQSQNHYYHEQRRPSMVSMAA